MKQRYPTYKSSGVEWIGEIPTHWEVSKTKYLTKNLDGQRVPLSSEERGDRDKIFPYWGSNGVIDFVDEFLFDGEFVLVGEDGSPFFDKLKDVSFYVNERVWVNNHIHILKPYLNKVNPRFLTHSFNITDYKNYISGSTRDKLTQSDLNTIVHVLPPLPEQEQIVKYLDEKTSQVDSLISITEKKIELLKQKRTSLINEVVTKGLNPDVELKDSGVEWIGMIPKHWVVKPLKSIVYPNQNTIPETTDQNYELEYVEISDVDGWGNITNKTKYLFSESPSRCRRVLQKGDVFISTVRTYLKSIGYVKEEVKDLICSTGFCVLTPKSILSEFLFYMVLSEWFIGEVISRSEGVSYPSITSTDLVQIKILYPPIEEQEQIVEYIVTHTSEIDKLVSIEKRRIETLKEYRQSLISEVVTGKIKVTE